MKRWTLWGISLLLFSFPAWAQTIPNWAPNTAYAKGALVLFNGVEYECIQAHTSEPGWQPPNVPALWQAVGTAPSCGTVPNSPTGLKASGTTSSSKIGR